MPIVPKLHVYLIWSNFFILQVIRGWITKTFLINDFVSLTLEYIKKCCCQAQAKCFHIILCLDQANQPTKTSALTCSTPSQVPASNTCAVILSRPFLNIKAADFGRKPLWTQPNSGTQAFTVRRLESYKLISFLISEVQSISKTKRCLC